VSTEEAFLRDDPVDSLKLEGIPNAPRMQVLVSIMNIFLIELIDFFQI